MRKILVLLMVLYAPLAQAKPYLDIQEVQTPKGLTVWFVQDNTVPVVSLQFSLKGGAQLDGAGKEGTAELLSTLLDEGAGKRDAEAFQDALDANSVRLGFNAGLDKFSGHWKTTVKNQAIAEELFDDALNRPHIDADAIGRMKDALQSHLRFQKMDPNWLAARTMYATLFKGTVYARPVEGTEASIAAITRDDLVRQKSRLFCRQRLTIAVVGDLATKDVQRLADRFFGAWPTCKDVASDTMLPLQQKGQTVQQPWQGAQSVVLMVQPGLKRQDKDWWAARILDFILGGGQFSSRLMNEVRVKRGLTYGVSTGLATHDLAPLWLVQAGVDPSKTIEAVALIKQVWADVAAHGLKADEVQEAKDYLIGSLPLALTSTDKIAAILLQLQEDDLPRTTLDTRADEINAVTLDDIKRVAHDHLHADQIVTIIAGPQKK